MEASIPQAKSEPVRYQSALALKPTNRYLLELIFGFYRALEDWW